MDELILEEEETYAGISGIGVSGVDQLIPLHELSDMAGHMNDESFMTGLGIKSVSVGDNRGIS